MTTSEACQLLAEQTLATSEARAERDAWITVALSAIKHAHTVTCELEMVSPGCRTHQRRVAELRERASTAYRIPAERRQEDAA